MRTVIFIYALAMVSSACMSEGGAYVAGSSKRDVSKSGLVVSCGVPFGKRSFVDDGQKSCVIRYKTASTSEV